METEIWRDRPRDSETGTSRELQTETQRLGKVQERHTDRSVGSETGTETYRLPNRDRRADPDTQTAPSTGDSGGGGAYKGASRGVASGFLRGVVQSKVWRGVSRMWACPGWGVSRPPQTAAGGAEAGALGRGGGGERSASTAMSPSQFGFYGLVWEARPTGRRYQPRTLV